MTTSTPIQTDLGERSGALPSSATSMAIGVLQAAAEPGCAVTLRPITTADDEFLRNLYANTRARELSVTQWTEEEKRHFCDSQFTFQDAFYRQHFPEALFDVVVVDRRRAGRLLVDFGTTEVVVLDIAVSPEWRNAGLGSLLLQWVQRMAVDAGLPVKVTVEFNNPARRLYERLGFRVRARGELRDEMEWRSVAVS